MLRPAHTSSVHDPGFQRSAVAPADNELILQAAQTFLKDVMCMPVNNMEFLKIYKVQNKFANELGSRPVHFQIQWKQHSVQITTKAT